MNENGVELFNIIQDPGGDCYCCCMDSLTTFRAIGKFERELFKVTYGFSEFSKKVTELLWNSYIKLVFECFEIKLF